MALEEEQRNIGGRGKNLRVSEPIGASSFHDAHGGPCVDAVVVDHTEEGPEQEHAVAVVVAHSKSADKLPVLEAATLVLVVEREVVLDER